MPKFLLFRNSLTPAIVSKTSEQSNYPAANILTPEKPFGEWRSTTTGAQDIVLDFGAAQSLYFFALLNINFDRYTLYGDTESSFASPDWQIDIVDKVYPDALREYRYYHWLHPSDTIGVTSKRYLKISIPSQTPLKDNDGLSPAFGGSSASYFRIGGLITANSVDSIFTPPRNPNQGFRIIPRKKVDKIEMLSGREETIELGKTYLEFNFDYEVDRYSFSELELFVSIFNIAQSRPIVVASDNLMAEYLPSTSTYSNSVCVYYMKRVSDPSYDLLDLNNADIRGITLRELI